MQGDGSANVLPKLKIIKSYGQIQLTKGTNLVCAMNVHPRTKRSVEQLQGNIRNCNMGVLRCTHAQKSKVD